MGQIWGSHPATMGKAARVGALHGLLEEILVWEVLVRLPPEALLRCRAVCRAWRSTTTTREFLLAHHAHQPALPLLDNGSYLGLDSSIYICCFDNRPGLATPDDQLQSVAFLNLGDDMSYCHPVASCDGLLIFCIDDTQLFICNPATREYAPLPSPPHQHWTLLGMYRHTLTGEYRLLLYSYELNPGNGEPVHACQVLSLGSGQPQRHVGWPDAITTGIMMELDPPVLLRGNLHWFPSHDDSESKMIMVFDTTSELFRQMRAPIVTDCAGLFELDGKLGMAILDLATTIDIWMLQDYKKEVWIFNCRMELPPADIRVQCDNYDGRLDLHVMVVRGDGELLVLVQLAEWLLLLGMDGKLVTAFHRKEVDATYLQLKQTLVPHTFFPTLEGYVVNAPPFI